MTKSNPRTLLNAKSKEELVEIISDFVVLEETGALGEGPLRSVVAETDLPDTMLSLVMVGYEAWRAIAIKAMIELSVWEALRALKGEL